MNCHWCNIEHESDNPHCYTQDLQNEIARLRAENKTWKDRYYILRDSFNEIMDENEQLKERLGDALAQRDAWGLTHQKDTAKLKVAVEALESIMDGKAWKTRTDYIQLTPRQLSGIAEDALNQIKE